MYELGDTLLFALSALKHWSWSAFRSAFDEMRTRKSVQVTSPERLASFSRWRCATTLDSLAHCDFTFSEGSGQLISSPAILASLPVAGLPRAVLCGSRSPEMFSTLLRHADEFRSTLRVTSISQKGVRYFAPKRIEIEADDISDLAGIAERMGIRFARVPPAWTLALRAGDLSGYLRRVTWSDDPEIGWQREDFDPCSIRFGPQRDARERLSRYQDPIRGVWRYRLVQAGRSALVEPSWGQWVALQWASRVVLEHNSTTGVLKVPANIPLPRLIARALVLCTGRVPALAFARAPQPSGGNSPERWAETYQAVPADVFKLIASKLGQF